MKGVKGGGGWSSCHPRISLVFQCRGWTNQRTNRTLSDHPHFPSLSLISRLADTTGFSPPCSLNHLFSTSDSHTPPKLPSTAPTTATTTTQNISRISHEISTGNPVLPAAPVFHPQSHFFLWADFPSFVFLFPLRRFSGSTT